MSSKLDTDPCAWVAPENLTISLGLQHQFIAEQIRDSQFLRDRINKQIQAILEPFPDELSDAHHALFEYIALFDEQALSELSRKMTLLMNHHAILQTTSGSLLQTIIEWCGTSDVIAPIRSGLLPHFQSFLTFNMVSLESFELYSMKLQAHLLGVLPSAYMQRLQLKMKPGQVQEPLYFDDEDPDRVWFLNYALIAHELEQFETKWMPILCSELEERKEQKKSELLFVGANTDRPPHTEEEVGYVKD